MPQLSTFSKDAVEKLENKTLFHMLDEKVDIHPEKEAVVIYSESKERSSLTFGEYKLQSKSLAAAFLDKGLARGDRVAIIAPNCLESALSQMALHRIGANVIILEHRWSLEEYIHELRFLKCKALVCHVGESSSQRNPVLEALQTIMDQPEYQAFKVVVTFGGDVPLDVAKDANIYSYGDLLSLGLSLPLAAVEDIQEKVHFDDPIMTLMTSGSTGRPKAAQMTHASLVNGTKIASCVTGINGESRFFTDSVFSWLSGIKSGLAIAACEGATLVLVPPATHTVQGSTKFFLDVLQKEQCTGGMFFPYVVHDIVTAGTQLRMYDLRHLKTCATGGEPVPQALSKSLLALLPSLKICLYYGATETGISSWQLLHKRNIDSELYGWMNPVPFMEIKIDDGESSTMQPFDTVGEVWVRGPVLFKEYLENAKATVRAKSANGCYKTNDAGIMDKQGRVKVFGRKDDVIRRAASTFYPAALEKILAKNPFVAQVSIVGVPDQRLYEEICACLVLRNGYTLKSIRSELESWCEAKFPPNTDGLSWKPGYFIPFDNIPQTRTGKPDRQALRYMAVKILQLTSQT